LQSNQRTWKSERGYLDQAAAIAGKLMAGLSLIAASDSIMQRFGTARALVEHPRADAMLAAQIHHFSPGLSQLQDLDDLLLGNLAFCTTPSAIFANAILRASLAEKKGAGHNSSAGNDAR
jgi:hypothetical protein